MAGPPADAPRAAEVVLLAAGRSSRMGEPKGLVVVDGRPWLSCQLDAVRDRPVVLVLGYDAERYLAALPGLPRAGVVLAVNQAPERGPFSSLQTGLGCVTPGAAAFVLPIDVPAASAEVWSALERTLASDPALEAAVPAYGQGTEAGGGHPVLLAPAFVAALVDRPVESRLDHELAASSAAGRVARVAVADPRVRLNLNAPEDWVKLRAGN